MSNYQIAVDLDKCMGCESCVAACMQENDLAPGIFYNKVLEIGPFGEFPKLEEYFLPVKCQHCEDAPCIHVCPTGASYRTEDGLVLIDHNKCVGCQYCVMACPYGVRTFNRAQKVIEKCTMCSHRVEGGEQPACVTICPVHARLFGDVDDPSSDISKYLDSHSENVRRLTDVGNRPGDVFVLSRAEWRE